MKLSASQILAIGAVGLAGAVLYYGSRKISDAAAAVNPTNPDNVINRGFNEALRVVGIIDEGGSLGSSIYDLFHPTYDPNQAIRGPLQ